MVSEDSGLLVSYTHRPIQVPILGKLDSLWQTMELADLQRGTFLKHSGMLAMF